MVAAFTRAPSGAEAMRRYRLIDDEFMRACLPGSPECIAVVIRAVTGRDDLDIVEVDANADLKSLVGRSLEFDVLACDADGVLYDIEIETAGGRFTPRRARFHSSMLDSRALAPGDGFEDLPEALVVVIAEDDVLGRNELLTRVERTAGPEASPFGDGSAILYVNCSKADASPLGMVAHDFLCADPDEMLVPELAERARLFKSEEALMENSWSSDPVVREFQQYHYGRGVEQGVEQGIEQGIRNLMANAGVDAAEAMRLLGVPEAERAKYESLLGVA